MGLHPSSGGRFVGRLQVGDPLRVPNRGLGVVARRGRFHQPNESPVRLAAQLLSLLQDPLVVAGRKEVPRIDARRELQIPRCQGVAK